MSLGPAYLYRRAVIVDADGSVREGDHLEASGVPCCDSLVLVAQFAPRSPRHSVSYANRSHWFIRPSPLGLAIMAPVAESLLTVDYCPFCRTLLDPPLGAWRPK